VKIKLTIETTNRAKVMRKANHDRIVEAMRHGVVERATTMRPKKGKGSYRRQGNVTYLD